MSENIKSDSKTDSIPRWPYIVLTWLCRIIVGGTFIVSGFSKSIDPWGTIYKINDYLDALGIHVWPTLVLVFVFLLCAAEFLIGVFAVLGCFRKGTPVSCVVVMAFMLLLSLWIAVSDPVSDCGCFGDAFIISNWATFWKNIVLMVCSLWLLKYNRVCQWIITPALQWIAFLVSSAFIAFIELSGYVYQPLIDFRAYPAGSSLIDENMSDAEPRFKFVYEKDGVRKEFTDTDTLPDEDSGWTFVERISSDQSDRNEKNNDEGNFRIWNVEDDEDVTDYVLASQGGQLLILMPDLKDVSIATSWQLNSMYDWASLHDIDVIAVVAGNNSDVSFWEDVAMPSYPIYTADDTSIKILARGNPAVIYLEDGIIKWKSTLKALDTDDFLNMDEEIPIMSFAHDNKRILHNSILLYCSVIGVLIILSFMTRLKIKKLLNISEKK